MTWRCYLNKAANSYWIDSRLTTQRPSIRALRLVPDAPARLQSIGATVARADARRRNFAIPSWVAFSMIVLATFAMCVTVTMRAHAGRRAAEQKYESINSDVERLRNTNATLDREVSRLRTDPRAIEAAARTRLNMVRADEVVVPIK